LRELFGFPALRALGSRVHSAQAERTVKQMPLGEAKLKLSGTSMMSLTVVLRQLMRAWRATSLLCARP